MQANNPIADTSPLHAIESRIQSQEASNYDHMAKNTNDAISKSSSSFKEETQHANQNTVTNFSKDLGSFFASQKSTFDNITNAISSEKAEVEKVALKVENSNSLLESSIKIQSEISMKLLLAHIQGLQKQT